MKDFHTIEALDCKLMKYEYNNIVLIKAARYFFEALLYVLFAMPLQEIKKEDRQMVIIISLFLLIAVSLYLQPYLLIKEEGKTVSIYKKLSYLPVSNSDISKVRCKYLFKYLQKIGLCILCIQVIASIVFERQLLVYNILYPLIMVGIFAGIPGLGMIYSPKWSK